MKRRVLGVIALLLSMSMLVVGCSSGSKGSTKEAEKGRAQETKPERLRLLTKQHLPILTVISLRIGQLRR